jgi:hypothetical protein
MHSNGKQQRQQQRGTPQQQVQQASVILIRLLEDQNNASVWGSTESSFTQIRSSGTAYKQTICCSGHAGSQANMRFAGRVLDVLF